MHGERKYRGNFTGGERREVIKRENKSDIFFQGVGAEG